MTRKQFFGTMIKYAAGIVGLATVTGAAGCGSSTNTPADAAGNCLANGTNVTIAANHGHVMMVAKVDVTAAVDKTYDIMGSALHTHSVTVTAANFATLAGNQMVTVTSTTTELHSHAVTVVCA